jgi:hypothetical protein
MLDEYQPVFSKEIERFSYQNKLDEALGFISFHVSDSLLFHIDDCKTLKESWDKLDSLFRKINEF